ncbi:aspartate aminotransferase family protein [Bradyrhizobium sp. U87765 SZCCT0131]|uniref:aspartate aminotransferase family protein n=1 Tax=unclassified Bradyrhizobium TaxID=2631580 RepID=UPI001BA6C2E0|nr:MULTISPECIES: aspartate aminotransferase family protein [unclassified Bradyrhizobium]MBR1217583.1 aspartate aminotransferase family protein [Bradyrhizobium sp. U87765 SZCCT0131]MBR1264819.1 aspartate aminotransferase family protein [Bradyrhizobium sp. U87765 SZCCT0134]MBR1304801.1 aspartate aminotransferase family protein [Bradyrhizobium sp. U87765 SZCCT0110]MBR1320588.1 aspartate aminotransferase family protein [Bradyrhizobium sp. U87765 SZCCT0109]MBR1349008.1 aspartate aminotransferase fa
MMYPNLDLSEMFAARQAERSDLHANYLNEQLVRVLKTIGYDVGFVRGEGQYLYDRVGARYLDLLSGFGVFAIGRNHPAVRNALVSVLNAELPNLVQMDVSTLAGVLAEQLIERVPYLDKVFFANSGTESVEAAIKFARVATGRTDIIYCGQAYHGLTYGSLSLTDDMNFRSGFEPLLPGCTSIPFNDLAALEKALSSRQVAAFIIEPIQGKGVNIPDDNFLPEAAALCRRYGTLFVADEVQTGLGRTGRFLAVEHWNVEPDMVLLAKALSGGQVPVGAVLTRRAIFNKVFDRMDRAVVHGSTFGKNDLAMAAGIATLEVMKQEKLIENAQQRGERLLTSLGRMVQKYELLKEVRGKGLMLGVQFGAPKSLALKASWNVLETASKGLFCQLITIPLFKDHKILTQVSGHGSHTIKLLPTLSITDEDCQWIESAFDTVIGASHRVPGAVWSLGKTLVDNAMRKSA